MLKTQLPLKSQEVKKKLEKKFLDSQKMLTTRELT